MRDTAMITLTSKSSSLAGFLVAVRKNRGRKSVRRLRILIEFFSQEFLVNFRATPVNFQFHAEI